MHDTPNPPTPLLPFHAIRQANDLWDVAASSVANMDASAWTVTEKYELETWQ